MADHCTDRAKDSFADSNTLSLPLIGADGPRSSSCAAPDRADCVPSLSALRRLEPVLTRAVPDLFPSRRPAPPSHGWYDLSVLLSLAALAAIGAATAAVSREQTLTTAALGHFDPSAASSTQVVSPAFRYEQYDADTQIAFDWQPHLFSGAEECLNVSTVFQQRTGQDLNALVNFSVNSALASWVVGAFEQYPDPPSSHVVYATFAERTSGLTLNYMGCGHFNTLAQCGFDPAAMCAILNDTYVPRGQEVFFRLGATQFTAATFNLVCTRSHALLRGDPLLDRMLNSTQPASYRDLVHCMLQRMQACVTSFNFTRVCLDSFARSDPPRFLNTYTAHPSALQVVAQVSTVVGLSYLALKLILAQVYWHWVAPPAPADRTRTDPDQPGPSG